MKQGRLSIVWGLKVEIIDFLKCKVSIVLTFIYPLLHRYIDGNHDIILDLDIVWITYSDDATVAWVRYMITPGLSTIA